MKRCPQCDQVFENDDEFCPHDAARLVAENFALPSNETDFEAETVVRREPFVVDLSEGGGRENVIQPTPVESVVVNPAPKNDSKNAAIYLALGLLLGAILVLATLILARSFYAGGAANDNAKTVAVNVSSNAPKNSALENRAETNANFLNKNALDAAATNAKHAARTSTGDEEFNGRVIALNAFVRASPSKSAAQIDILPLNDRINIERRENESSPWFYVTCEHGTSGWMHGDTIEYTNQ